MLTGAWRIGSAATERATANREVTKPNDFMKIDEKKAGMIPARICSSGALICGRGRSLGHRHTYIGHDAVDALPLEV